MVSTTSPTRRLVHDRRAVPPENGTKQPSGDSLDERRTIDPSRPDAHSVRRDPTHTQFDAIPSSLSSTRPDAHPVRRKAPFATKNEPTGSGSPGYSRVNRVGRNRAVGAEQLAARSELPRSLASGTDKPNPAHRERRSYGARHRHAEYRTPEPGTYAGSIVAVSGNPRGLASDFT
jgi:hypothetical protein